jgi:hypothetical protein
MDFSVYLGKLQDSTPNLAMATSFDILPSSLFITIECYMGEVLAKFLHNCKEIYVFN